MVPAEVEQALKAISQREGKPISELLRPKIEEYAKAHLAGNNQFRVDNWADQPTLQAFPTMGEVLTPALLGKLSDSDLKELSKQASGRNQEIIQELKRRGTKEWGPSQGDRIHRPPWND